MELVTIYPTTGRQIPEDNNIQGYSMRISTPVNRVKFLEMTVRFTLVIKLMGTPLMQVYHFTGSTNIDYTANEGECGIKRTAVV